MLSFILLSSTLLVDSAWAAITDLNCTHIVANTPKYAPSAVNCQNKLSDASCTLLYTAAVKVDTDTDRDPKCGVLAGPPPSTIPELVRTAIDLCPQFCGSSRTPAFACQDKQPVHAGSKMDSAIAHSTRRHI
ncbi:hypothetical protein COOONC_11323 [Cooperia oncophora]